ncbi:neurotactin [Parasteatoda tepidariorum]|uniref:neurotactin n=1 Tax=Parasteatoda tepidariorum TaxID=114398 RepID=UPI001C71D3A7|nr:neurotactin isoform X1 [Parasteatoda tepidariorum]XP_042900446.1 neurotactin isoform X2 [Parasteatoda tepidariorum]
MTAELEEQEKKGEKEMEVEKTPSPKDEDAPKNGGGDVKKEEVEEEKEEEKKEVEEEKKAETDTEEQQQEEEEIAPSRARPLPFWKRLFKRGPENKQDVEAGTELLSKDGKAEIKAGEEGKNGKAGSNTDVAVAVTDGKEEEGEEAKAAKSKEADQKRGYWQKVAISLVCIVIVLVIVSVVSVITSSGHSNRGPLGEPVAVTECGPVRGYKQDDMYIFKGVPYALPPIGELRWKPPMKASTLNECWTGTYEAYNSSAICYQKPIPGLNLEMSEDCLYLDIITPSLSPPILRPVVVYIPGDHPVKGFTADDIKWRPTTSVADSKDVTFVTLNYRTNVFGFLVSDLLTNRMRPPTSGNYGIMDMIAALKWVQRNIRSFGGDPNRVTVLAHGGGATAGLALLSSKKTSGLFHQMWLTAPSAKFSNKTLTDISSDNSALLTKLKCDSLSCLYNKTADEILAAVPGFWAADWSHDLPSSEEELSPEMVVVDGDVLYNTPFHMWKEGDILQVPVVIGATAQESGSSKMIHDLDRWTWTDFSDYVSEKLETISDNRTVTALQYYIQNDTTPQQQFHSMVSDVRTICPLERLNEALNDALDTDSYWYLVDYIPSSPIQFSNESAAVRLAVHGLDIAAIFGIMDNYIDTMSPSDLTFQKNMQDLFYSFISTTKPEIKGERLMASNFINMIGEAVRSRMTPYDNCYVWNNDIFYPTYAKMN